MLLANVPKTTVMLIAVSSSESLQHLLLASGVQCNSGPAEVAPSDHRNESSWAITAGSALGRCLVNSKFKCQSVILDLSGNTKKQSIEVDRVQQVLHKYARLEVCGKKILGRFHWTTGIGAFYPDPVDSNVKCWGDAKKTTVSMKKQMKLCRSKIRKRSCLSKERFSIILDHLSEGRAVFFFLCASRSFPHIQ